MAYIVLDLTFTYAILFDSIVTVEQDDGDGVGDIPGKDDDWDGVPQQAKQTNTVQQNTYSRIGMKIVLYHPLAIGGAKNYNRWLKEQMLLLYFVKR